MDYNYLNKKAKEIRTATLLIHKQSVETRVASSLSPIEIFVALYYGDILKFYPNNPQHNQRDRFIVSKGHGSISLYPILADLGFFEKKELQNICNNGAFLGGIPDPMIPGYETINGSLGHGLGVGCGIAIALKKLSLNQNVIVLVGDGELNEGSVWEATMFAAMHKLDNLTLIVDNNRASMLDFSKKILDLNNLSDKFEAFAWDTQNIVNGHDIEITHKILKSAIYARDDKPKVVIANTIKGKGVPFLETNPLSHILSVNANDIDDCIEEINNGQ